MIDPVNGAAMRAAQMAQPQTQAIQGSGDVAATSEGSSFGDTLKDALGDVSDVQEHANDTIQAFLRGDAVELHEVMAATEEAGIALEMLIELRNKMTDAYRTIINMQA